MREAHVPAEHPPAQEAPRVPPSDVDPGGPSDREESPPAGADSTLRLIWRVRGRATFAALARARPQRVGPVVVRRVPARAGEPPKVAYSSTRGVGGAVARNRLRRRLRAAVADARDQLGDGHAYLVTGGSEALTMPFADLRAAVAQALDGPVAAATTS
jgi:ribonuclease P protein component